MAHYIVRANELNPFKKTVWKYLKPRIKGYKFVIDKEDAHKFRSRKNALKASLHYMGTHVIQIEKMK